jgi:hypothetical protein
MPAEGTMVPSMGAEQRAKLESEYTRRMRDANEKAGRTQMRPRVTSFPSGMSNARGGATRNLPTRETH